MFISTDWQTFAWVIIMAVAVILLVLLAKNKISARTSFIVAGIIITIAAAITFVPSFTPEAKELRTIRAERSEIQQTAKQCVEIHGELTPHLKERIESHNQSVDALDTDSFWMKALTDNDTSKYYINEQELTERQDDSQ